MSLSMIVILFFIVMVPASVTAIEVMKCRKLLSEIQAGLGKGCCN